jgi:tripartite-type tricarboxylate transporter receptor subunit TctC
LSAAAIAVATLIAGPVAADSASDFYKGKKLTIYLGVSPGGIYGTFAHMLSKHIVKQMPHNPTTVISVLRGAGGTKAINYIYNVAPQDGSVAMTPNAGVAKRVLLRIGKPKYDPSKLQWLGGWGEATNTVTIRKDAGVNSLKEAMEKEVILGAIGRSSNTYMMPALINNTLGTKFKIITGYRGGSPIRKAIETGELHGWSGQWLGWKLRKADWIRGGKIVNLVQMASKKDPDLPNVPLLSELAKTDEMRAMFEFVETGLGDKSFIVAPGVPKARAAVLSKAYMATLRDAAFVGEMTKRRYTIDPIEQPVIEKLVKKVMSTPPKRLAKLRKLMGLTGGKKKIPSNLNLRRSA